MNANDKQVGGSHYQGKKYQHWDIVVEHDLDYFQSQITKYVMRCKKKGGVEDLKKAAHFLEKYMEVFDHYAPTMPVGESSGTLTTTASFTFDKPKGAKKGSWKMSKNPFANDVRKVQKAIDTLKGRK